MKVLFLPVFIFSLLFIPCQASAQSNITTTTKDMSFNSSDTSQWLKDMRRFDIITFGIFPFSMFFVTFATDMLRWNDANSFDMSEEGRRYAPWPAKSAGAVEMTDDEYKRTILLAAGVSIGFAIIDLAIVLIRRNSDRRRAESLPTSTFKIEKSPYGIDPEAEDSGDADTDENTESTE